ncbi:MAG: carboxymuconolactone decarboxylase, partial [Acidimicrobiales bacterium]
MTEDMRVEMERCAREGTPRPESSAVRAHVPAAFWFFANGWNDLFRNGVCDHAIKELCRVYISRTLTSSPRLAEAGGFRRVSLAVSPGASSRL